MKKLLEIEVDSWDKYLELISSEKYKNWAFRGQADPSWHLWPTITRELMNRSVKQQYWEKQEHRIIWIFQRKSIHYLEKTLEVTDIFQWLALMQHHGAPTRLLDFTWSPYVAAFFALEPSTLNAAVWAINTPALGSMCFTPEIFEENWVPSPKDALQRYNIKNVNEVAIGEPFYKNQRLIAQSGTFVCPYDITKPVDEILSRRENIITKFVLNGRKLRQQALNELYRMNITHATLFPDFDGLARSLRYELETHYRYEPTDSI
jgi:hypothetical protein